MRLAVTAIVASLALAQLPACGSNPAEAPGQAHITGVAALAGFPAQPTAVQVIAAGAVVTEAPVASDGRFEVDVPVGTAYRIEFVHALGRTGLVFPRQSGIVEATFDVRGELPFELGTVRYIGDPATQSFTFLSASGPPAQKADGPGDADEADGDEVECEDGVDPSTGAVCVDDDDEEGAGVCEGDDVDDDTDEESGADEEDPATCGAEADPATGQCDDETDDGDEEGDEEDDDLPTDAAVPEHNLPAQIGCDDDTDDHDCDNGIDPATGAECDGGPAANSDDG